MAFESNEIQRLCRISSDAILQGMKAASIYDRQEYSVLLQFYRNINAMAIRAGRLEISLGIERHGTKPESEQESEVGTSKLIRPFAEGSTERNGQAPPSTEGTNSPESTFLRLVLNPARPPKFDS